MRRPWRGETIVVSAKQSDGAEPAFPTEIPWAPLRITYGGNHSHSQVTQLFFCSLGFHSCTWKRIIETVPMSYDFPGHAALSLLMAVALLTILTSIAAMYMLLVQIELQATLTFDDAEEDVELEESPEDDGYVNASNVVNKGAVEKEGTSTSSVQVEEETGPARRLRLPNFRRAALAGIVAIITFMSYLLLAVSNANFILQWIGMAIILGILMRPTIFEEVRRDRYDRLASLLSLLLVLAMSLNLMVYANQQHAQGDIYEGKARIIGYDYESYSQEKDDKILRTDLEVAWGGEWGCPNVPDQSCTAYVSGALCETEEKNRRSLFSMKKPHFQRSRQLSLNPQNSVPSERRIHNRRLDDQNIEQVEDEEVENATEDGNASTNDNEEDNAKTYEELEKENEELQQENAYLEAQNTELTEEVAEDEETINEYEQYAYDEDEIIEELDEEITVYYFDDGMCDLQNVFVLGVPNLTHV